ncbi:MAG: alpha/beta hydrolase, partial [Leptospiraceae bacterium]|nr:alpha/beta hydrolase [Leptospiraceae bacterium]
MAQFLINCGPSQKGNSKTSNNEVLLAVLQGTDSTQTSINETDPKSLEVVEASPEEEKEFQDKIQEAFAELNDGSFTFSDKEYITSFDGTKIDGNIFVPSSASKDSKRPVVIFINSWALNEYEYLVPAAKLAKKGYIVFSYSTRGFGKSEGLINVAGPKDMKDLSAVIDYLELNYPIQKGNIGLSGISYGGGTSLLGLANEPRVRTAVAMSGWT